MGKLHRNTTLILVSWFILTGLTPKQDVELLDESIKPRIQYLKINKDLVERRIYEDQIAIEKVFFSLDEWGLPKDAPRIFVDREFIRTFHEQTGGDYIKRMMDQGYYALNVHRDNPATGVVEYAVAFLEMGYRHFDEWMEGNRYEARFTIGNKEPKKVNSWPRGLRKNPKYINVTEYNPAWLFSREKSFNGEVKLLRSA